MKGEKGYRGWKGKTPPPLLGIQGPGDVTVSSGSSVQGHVEIHTCLVTVRFCEKVQLRQ